MTSEVSVKMVDDPEQEKKLLIVTSDLMEIFDAHSLDEQMRISVLAGVMAITLIHQPAIHRDVLLNAIIEAVKVNLLALDTVPASPFNADAYMAQLRRILAKRKAS